MKEDIKKRIKGDDSQGEPFLLISHIRWARSATRISICEDGFNSKTVTLMHKEDLVILRDAITEFLGD